MAPAIGDRIGGKYELKAKLARGGSGEVWRAIDPSGKDIALKFLTWLPGRSKERAAERFKNEFGILKNLSHPNIGDIYDFGRDPESEVYFFTSELLTGGNLREQTSSTVEEIEEFLLQSLRALEYLRHQGLLHLDLKPQNILLRKNHSGKHDEIALIDFGLSSFRPPDKPGGTPSFMPPEIIVRRFPDLINDEVWPEPDHRSDLYSLGVTFYTVLTGKNPFRRHDAQGRFDAESTMRAHFEVAPPPPSAFRPDIPAYLDRLILKLMAHHPDDRYPSAAIAAQALHYSSPRDRTPETPESLLAYLPKEGKLIGRELEQRIIIETLNGVMLGKTHIAPIIAIGGEHGSGRSRLISFIKPAAQQREMVVTECDAEDAAHAPSLITLLEQAPMGPNHLHCILVDNVHELLRKKPLSPAEEELLRGMQLLSKRLALQQRISDLEARRFYLAFTFDPARTRPKEVFGKLGLEAPTCHLLALNHFTSKEIEVYLESLLGESPGEEIVTSLEAATEGNPLFVTELLEQMIAKGRLFALAGRPKKETLKSIGLDFAQATPSASLKKALLEKLVALPRSTRSVAEELACFHRPATVDELQQCNPNVDVAAAISGLVTCGIIKRHHHNGVYLFANALSAKVILKELISLERQQWHDVIARVVQNPHELDWHLAHGSDWEMRVEALWRLVDRMWSAHQHHLAIEHLAALLQELPHDAWEKRAEALLRLGKAFDRSRQYERAEKTFRHLEELDAPPNLKRLFRVQSYEQRGIVALRRRELRIAHRMFEKAMQLMQDTWSDTGWHIRLENDIAAVKLRGGDPDQARELYLKTREAAMQKLMGKERLAVTNNELGESTLSAGHAQESIPILKEELDEASRARHMERLANRYYLLGEAHSHHDVDAPIEAMKFYQEGLKLAKERHLLDLEVRLHSGIGNLYTRQGNHAEAVVHYRSGLELAQQIESETVTVELMTNLGIALSRTQRPQEAIDYLEAALDFASGPRGVSGSYIRHKRPEILITLGGCLHTRHAYDRAEQYLKEARELDEIEPLADAVVRYNLYGTLVEIYLETARPAEARSLLSTLRSLVAAVPEAQGHFEGLVSGVEGA